MHRALATYAGAPTGDAELLKRYGSLVERLARRLVLRTGLQSAYDDLWSAGALGLIEASRRFDEARGTSFETFAEHRVRGAMMDELRRLDHLPRRLRSRTDDLTKARRKLASDLGRDPSREEVAAELGTDVEEVSEMEALLEPHLPLESALPFLTEGRTIDDTIARAEAVRALSKAIERLPERLQTVLGLLYNEGLSYREVGELLEVSDARVCQLHSEALGKLRGVMGKDDKA